MGLCLSLFKKHHVEHDVEHVSPTYISSRIFATLDPISIMEYRISVTQNSGSVRDGRGNRSVRNGVNYADLSTSYSHRTLSPNIVRISMTERRPRIIDYTTSEYLPMK